MTDIGIGIIGLGNIGSLYARMLTEGRIQGARLSAVCSTIADEVTRHSPVLGFHDADELFRSRAVDAVIIATPHPTHVALGTAALKAGLHVLVEKPIAVHVAEARRLIEAHRDHRQVFAIMFQTRLNPHYRKLKQLIAEGELGAFQRINWIVTDWFRSHAYYRSGGWRATWRGEGGGVLLNQCPHNLDIWQWLFGMPDRVEATCRLGRYHEIEVEDDVTAYLEYDHGATGVLITTTGEAPGTNRLEVAGDRGRVVLENGNFEFLRNEVPTPEFSRRSDNAFARPPQWNVSIPINEPDPSWTGMLQNFADAIRLGTPLVSPAAEGIHSLELANAMLLSSFKRRAVSLPIDPAEYQRLLDSLIEQSAR